MNPSFSPFIGHFPSVAVRPVDMADTYAITLAALPTARFTIRITGRVGFYKR